MDYSYQELLTTYDDVIKAFLGDPAFIKAEVDVANNVVKLDLAAQPASSFPTAMDGAPLAISVGGRAIEGRACSRTACGPPWRGGTTGSKSSSGTWDCTMGFMFMNGSVPWWSTAGHCTAVGQSWYHNHTFAGEVGGDGFVDGSSADAAVLPVATSYGTDDIFLDDGLALRDISSAEGYGPSYEIIGQTQCMSAPSGYTCGTLLAYPVTVDVTVGGTTHRIYNGRKSSIDSYAGDSGAPIFYSGEAQGMLSSGPVDHSYGIYSHVRNIMSRFGLTLKTS